MIIRYFECFLFLESFFFFRKGLMGIAIDFGNRYVNRLNFGFFD